MPDARQCRSCNFGPVEHRGCADLNAHHGDQQGRVRNSCVRCGWFSAALSDWPRWDGNLPSTADDTMDQQDIPLFSLFATAELFEEGPLRDRIIVEGKALPGSDKKVLFLQDCDSQLSSVLMLPGATKAGLVALPQYKYAIEHALPYLSRMKLEEQIELLGCVLIHFGDWLPKELEDIPIVPTEEGGLRAFRFVLDRTDSVMVEIFDNEASRSSCQHRFPHSMIPPHILSRIHRFAPSHAIRRNNNEVYSVNDFRMGDILVHAAELVSCWDAPRRLKIQTQLQGKVLSYHKALAAARNNPNAGHDFLARISKVPFVTVDRCCDSNSGSTSFFGSQDKHLSVGTFQPGRPVAIRDLVPSPALSCWTAAPVVPSGFSTDGIESVLRMPDAAIAVEHCKRLSDISGELVATVGADTLQRMTKEILEVFEKAEAEQKGGFLSSSWSGMNRSQLRTCKFICIQPSSHGPGILVPPWRISLALPVDGHKPPLFAMPQYIKQHCELLGKLGAISAAPSSDGAQVDPRWSSTATHKSQSSSNGALSQQQSSGNAKQSLETSVEMAGALAAAEDLKSSATWLLDHGKDWFADVEVTAKDGKVFALHRCILASRCPGLRTRLKPNDAPPSEKLEFPKAGGKALNSVMKFVYTGATDNLLSHGVEVALETLVLAVELELPVLKQALQSEMISNSLGCLGECRSALRVCREVTGLEVLERAACLVFAMHMDAEQDKSLIEELSQSQKDEVKRLIDML
eukprot:gnl/MRDRNA2_/MRDRNA2_176156_c0_seq1.p1 gnl/MRDRNA2_/MRDRNA2_176156_c0~~gnl/MRDRNA2_/MRDRNA2_176156_c0_seq1.p1  ORF type:complete len:808 (+),score=147.09 gnl/MRDRNA2_/MRDRNA2_176156_c0_seq1:190-2424(+)